MGYEVLMQAKLKGLQQHTKLKCISVLSKWTLWTSQFHTFLGHSRKWTQRGNGVFARFISTFSSHHACFTWRIGMNWERIYWRVECSDWAQSGWGTVVAMSCSV